MRLKKRVRVSALEEGKSRSVRNYPRSASRSVNRVLVPVQMRGTPGQSLPRTDVHGVCSSADDQSYSVEVS